MRTVSIHSSQSEHRVKPDSTEIVNASTAAIFNIRPDKKWRFLTCPSLKQPLPVTILHSNWFNPLWLSPTRDRARVLPRLEATPFIVLTSVLSLFNGSLHLNSHSKDFSFYAQIRDDERNSKCFSPCFVPSSTNDNFGSLSTSFMNVIHIGFVVPCLSYSFIKRHSSDERYYF